MNAFLHSLLVRSRRRRILLPFFANAKPLPEAGNNNYLGSECDHLPEAGNICIGIHPSVNKQHHLSLHTSAYSLWAPPKAANALRLEPRANVVLTQGLELEQRSRPLGLLGGSHGL